MPANLQAPPRAAELWPAIVTRVSTARMATILGGTGRVFVEGDYSGPQWAENQPGGRLVIVPTLPLAGIGSASWVQGHPHTVGFLVRTDFNNYTAPGYNASVGMEAAQREAFDQLSGWTPAPFTRAMVAFPVYMVRSWQPRALYDEATGTVYLSSEYRVDLANAP